MLMRPLSEDMKYSIKNRQLFVSTLMPLNLPLPMSGGISYLTFLTDVHMHATAAIC
jgi:hypothetical protein